MNIDYSLYPDMDRKQIVLETCEQRADYLARVCAVWDFGIVPSRSTFTLLSGWREVFDRFPLSSSPAYHVFRETFGWPAVPAGPFAHANYEGAFT